MSARPRFHRSPVPALTALAAAALLVLLILPAASSPAATGAVRCQLSQLAISLRGGQVGAGNQGTNVVFTNRSASACTLYGYPGYGLLDAKRYEQTSTVLRGSTYFQRDPGKKTITLQPGKSAYASLAWSVIAGLGEPTDGPCEPKSAWLEVTPPNAYRHAVLRFNQTVCSHGKLTTTAVAAGTGS